MPDSLSGIGRPGIRAGSCGYGEGITQQYCNAVGRSLGSGL